MSQPERSDSEWEDVTFRVEVTMRRRWAAQFLGLLKRMQLDGHVGASETLAFFSDGDGDFRPKFIFDAEASKIPPAEPSEHGPYGPTWDAG